MRRGSGKSLETAIEATATVAVVRGGYVAIEMRYDFLSDSQMEKILSGDGQVH
jgi:hypothetical protein